MPVTETLSLTASILPPSPAAVTNKSWHTLRLSYQSLSSSALTSPVIWALSKIRTTVRELEHVSISASIGRLSPHIYTSLLNDVPHYWAAMQFNMINASTARSNHRQPHRKQTAASWCNQNINLIESLLRERWYAGMKHLSEQNVDFKSHQPNIPLKLVGTHHHQGCTSVFA